jgi:hypothetical protein
VSLDGHTLGARIPLRWHDLAPPLQLLRLRRNYALSDLGVVFLFSLDVQFAVVGIDALEFLLLVRSPLIMIAPPIPRPGVRQRGWRQCRGEGRTQARLLGRP